MMNENAATRPQLSICLTCAAIDQKISGRKLYDAVREANDGSVEVVGVNCLASCRNTCSATISMPGKWGWLMGHLHAGLAQDLLTYVAAYRRSARGVVVPSKRPASLEKIMIGRFPTFMQRDLT